MQHKERESPTATHSVERAVRDVGSSPCCDGDGENLRSARPKRQGRPRTFADWMLTEAPDALGLDSEVVARIRRAMAPAEMRGVSTITGLLTSLRFLRPFYDDDLAWGRFVLAARYLYLTYRGRT
jgi:hypothetical protein